MAAKIEVPEGTEPEAVLDRLAEIERELGRGRHGRNASRVLDLDLLVLGERIVSTDRLTLPHPRMWSRRFVLAPLAEIVPELRDPRTGRTVVETLASLPDRPWARNAGPLAPRERAPVYSGRL
jgi:2-amino-4-hydroxy-6-hydroxymethyldihydropteridine diphosphokinase